MLWDEGRGASTSHSKPLRHFLRFNAGNKHAVTNTSATVQQPIMLKFLIADDHPLFRDALRTSVLKIWPNAAIHEAEHVQALYALAAQHNQADLLLLDLGMPGGVGLDPLLHLRAHHPQLPIAIVSAHEDSQLIRRAMEHGALGYIPKSSDLHTLSQALHTILEGEPWFPQDITHGTPSAEDDFHATRIAELTPQQARILQMVAAGRLNKQIAHDLGLSEATIKAHMTAVLRKLGASNRTEAVAIARKLGLA